MLTRTNLLALTSRLAPEQSLNVDRVVELNLIHLRCDLKGVHR